LIKYIENQNNNSYAQKNVIDLLFIFSIMIEKSDHIRDIQNLFNKNGAVKMVLTILSNPVRPDVQMIASILRFLNSLLLGCNVELQRTIHNYFKNYKSSSMIFKLFNEILEAQIDKLKALIENKSTNDNKDKESEED
jgi:hypothetical protein